MDYRLVDSFFLYYHRRDLRRALYGLSSMADSSKTPITTITLPDGDEVLLPCVPQESPPRPSLNQIHLNSHLILPMQAVRMNEQQQFISIQFEITILFEERFVEITCSPNHTQPGYGVDFQRGFLDLLEASGGLFGAVDCDLHTPRSSYLDDPAQIVLIDGWLFPGLRMAESIVKARQYTLRHRGQDHAAFYRDWVLPFLPFFLDQNRPYHYDKYDRFLQQWTQWTDEEAAAFIQVYEAKLPFITPAILRQLLFDLDVEYQKIGACLTGLGKWTELTPEVGEQLLRYPWRFPFCFALACFNHEQAAGYFQQFLDQYLVVPYPDDHLSNPSNTYHEVLAALLRCDATHATHHAEPYLQPDGLWTRYEAYHHENRPRFSADDDPPFIPRSAIDWMELGQALTPALKFASTYFGECVVRDTNFVAKNPVNLRPPDVS